MLLKQMLDSPATSSNLVVFDPFAAIDREALVKEVVGLANARMEGARRILFGVNPGAVNGSNIVGISEDAVADLKKAHRLVSALVEPHLALAFVFDNVNGKLVGALEIDGCDFGPYFVAHDLSEELYRGACWIREDRELRAVQRTELLNGQAQEEPAAPVALPENVSVSVGFNEDPDCEVLEVAVPDTSDPPFADDDNELRKTSRLTQALKETVSTVTTQILGLRSAGKESDGEDMQADEAGKLVAAAKKHYYYEERAVKIDLCLRNDGTDDIQELHVELGFPQLQGFDIADRLYTSPFDKRSEAEIRKLGYPEVKFKDDGIFVRDTVELLEPDKPQPLFRSSLRIAAGPDVRGKKVAILYVLRAPDGKRVGNGRLKIQFARDPA